ncbi:MAG TPA: hypothetical protein VFE91_03425 [Nitrososphaerales archaeon]|nr:hypothetical protein [Nitrososphaerales archaeon]
MNWFAAVGIITLALVPIRLYLLSANDWLVGALATLALLFFIMYFLVVWFWKPEGVVPAP